MKPAGSTEKRELPANVFFGVPAHPRATGMVCKFHTGAEPKLAAGMARALLEGGGAAGKKNLPWAFVSITGVEKASAGHGAHGSRQNQSSKEKTKQHEE